MISTMDLIRGFENSKHVVISDRDGSFSQFMVAYGTASAYCWREIDRLMFLYNLHRS
jgi:hypothetical protein